MDPIETLMAEHRLIERTLDALEACAARVGRGELSDRAELGRFARFFSAYADAYHHGKEEDLLFAAMIEAGFPKDTGPIAAMLHEHDIGRSCVEILKDSAERTGDLTPEERREVADAAGTYAAMLRSHIRKEDRILYPMAESHLPPEAFALLASSFDRFEGEKGPAAEGLLALAAELRERHVAFVPAAAPSAGTKLPTKVGHGGGCCGCGH